MGRLVTMSQPPTDQQLSDLSDAVRLGKRSQAVELTKSLARGGHGSQQLVDAMIDAMDEVGPPVPVPGDFHTANAHGFAGHE